jgi:secreted trypsin-like serine protease
MSKMVATVTDYTDLKNRALIGSGYDGVVRVVTNGFYGTGTLLFGGQAVLTAAHLFLRPEGIAFANTNVQFETMWGLQSIGASDVCLHPGYDGLNSLNDLALVWLTQNAPASAQRFGLYRGLDEMSQTFTMVGYGVPGLGASGALTSFNQAPVRVIAQNQFDVDTASLGSYFSTSGAWESIRGKQLAADFDNGLAQNDALGVMAQSKGLGLGELEGLITQGDSGGPAFINGLLAGIASFSARLSYQLNPNTLDGTTSTGQAASVTPDVDTQANSSYGEVASWQRVSAYQQWIDQSLRAHDTMAPQSLSQVKKSVPEGDSGTSLAYFWVQLNGARAGLNETVSLDYQTRSGTAQQGEDFLESKGTLKLYPGEDHALVAVEILGDMQPEEDEYFYLDVFNPVGSAFERGLVKLTAVRTILSDDGWIFSGGGF